MGFFDSLLGAVKGDRKCPLCGAPGGQAGSGGTFRCPNPICLNFDPTLTGGQAVAPMGQSAPPPISSSSAPPPAAAPAGPRPAGTIEITYRNHANVEKRFVADLASLHRTKGHIRAQVAPKGIVITLARKRITNLDEVEQHMPARVAPNQAWPTPKERQVLGYHAKHHTTSPLYEKIRAKYPNW
jgi:hypothetical protein